MAIEAYDLIDTAVKVGLGAAISAISSYSINRSNHKNDKEKSLANRRIEILTATATKLEAYFTAFDRCCSRLNGLIKAGKGPGPFADEAFKLYKEIDNNFLAERASRSTSAAQMRLIGMKKTANTIEETIKCEKELRDIAIFQKLIPSQDELQNIANKMNSLRFKIYEQMSSSFEIESSKSE